MTKAKLTTNQKRLKTLVNRGYFVEAECSTCFSVFLIKPADKEVKRLKFCPKCRVGVKERLEIYKSITMDDIFNSLDQQNII